MVQRLLSAGWMSLALMVLLAGFGPAETLAADGAPPRVFSCNPATLVENKARVAQKDPALMPAFDALISDANAALQFKPVSVMDAKLVGPTGDRHNYFSLGRYYWPNPDTKNGLPWISRDGHSNEAAIADGDSPRLFNTCTNVDSLALAYWFTGDAKYSKHAGELLRVFFLDPATKMNPNLDGAQAIPGVNNGRGIGLIESRHLFHLVDDLGLLEGAPGWSAEDASHMRDWLGQFHQWLEKSPNAKDERGEANNHGTWFAVQETSIMLYLGLNVEAKQRFQAAKMRIAAQIQPDGQQPEETRREDGLGYSIFNLEALCNLANLARSAQVDLWHYQTPDGRSIRKGMDYITPYVLGEKPWPFKELRKITPQDMLFMVLQTRIEFPGAYEQVLEKIPQEKVKADRIQLFTPAQK